MNKTKGKALPGPWEKEWTTPPLVQYAGWWIKEKGFSRFPIAFVTQTVGGKASPQEANANLIAAAPDMIDTLRYLETVLSEESEENWAMELNRIRMTIAKAGVEL